MPSFKVKPETYGAEVAEPSKKKYYPTVYFPVDKKILAATEVGADVVVTLKGKVTALESREGDGTSRNECRVEIYEVSLYAENEYEKMSREDK